MREDTRHEIQQIASHVDETRNKLEHQVAEQLAKFNEAKHNLNNFLVSVHTFEEWLNETEAELETCWPLGADLPLLLEKGVYINEVYDNYLYEPKPLCIFIYIYIYYIHTYIRTCIPVHSPMYAYTVHRYIHKCVLVYVCMHTYDCTI